MVKTAGKAG